MHVEKCSDLQQDVSSSVLLQGQGSDVPLSKKQDFNCIPGAYELASLYRGGAF